MHWKISARADGGTSERSSVKCAQTVSEDPHRRERKFNYITKTLSLTSTINTEQHCGDQGHVDEVGAAQAHGPAVGGAGHGVCCEGEGRAEGKQPEEELRRLLNSILVMAN